MLKIENYEVMGWEHAIRGMRNPKNSWEKSDSEPGCEIITGSHEVCRECDHVVRINGDISGCLCNSKRSMVLGPNDQKLMTTLRNAGTDHRKFLRMITVYLDITAPLYWWKEFKTYRAGRKFGDPEPDIIDPELLEMDIETNSCSTMHKIHAKKFELDDFSHEHLSYRSIRLLGDTIDTLNDYRHIYLDHTAGDSYVEEDGRVMKKKDAWWQMIQLLPSSYNQKRTVMLNYEVLANIYKSRRHHKLDEWHTLCDWIEGLPYSELITGEVKEK